MSLKSETLHILHLEDNQYDSEIIAATLKKSGLAADIEVARDRREFLSAIESKSFDVVLSDNNLPGFDGTMALRVVREKQPSTPFIFVSGFADREDAVKKQRATGAADCVSKSELDSLKDAILRSVQAESATPVKPVQDAITAYVSGMERLVSVVQELSLARDLDHLMVIVRQAARELTGADGATFVLRDGDQCHYADEEAIAPLWKGRRFPMSQCISGWVMLNRQAVVIEDIYADDRIPVDAYRRTFVQSLAMVPIRSAAPIGAIGVYWATKRSPQPHEVKLLQALADSASIAMENVQLYRNLEQKVADRTARLKTLNAELETYSDSVSHDLRAPLRHIGGYLEMIRDDQGNALTDSSRRHLAVIADAARRMETLIEDLLEFSRMGRTELHHARVNMNRLVEEVRQELLPETKNRAILWDIGDLPEMNVDRALVKQVWSNLIGNALKYTRQRPRAEIRVGGVAGEGESIFFVEDNGVGFDMQDASKLFGAFQRLHRQDEFEGSGIGLANVRRIVERHGGRTWAKAEPDRGATFYFTLPTTRPLSSRSNAPD
jgi:signal transduction histidine kinase/FixJ family two-component response regulator